MARHSGNVVNPKLQKKLKAAYEFLSEAINGKEIDQEDLVIPKEFVEKILEDYHEKEEFEKCKLVKNFLDKKPSYVKDITAQEWYDNYLMK